MILSESQQYLVNTWFEDSENASILEVLDLEIKSSFLIKEIEKISNRELREPLSNFTPITMFFFSLFLSPLPPFQL